MDKNRDDDSEEIPPGYQGDLGCLPDMVGAERAYSSFNERGQ